MYLHTCFASSGVYLRGLPVLAIKLPVKGNLKAQYVGATVALCAIVRMIPQQSVHLLVRAVGLRDHTPQDLKPHYVLIG
jgi:hypothetical protein